MSVPSHAHARTMALHMTPGVRKHVPVAEHPADSRKPQRSPTPQSASVVQVPASAPGPEPLLDPELPLDDPEPPLDPEVPLDDPDPPLDPELPLDDPDPPLDPELPLDPEPPLDEPEPPFDPEPPPDPELPLGPELLPEVLSAAASSEGNVTLLPEQPMA
jgi:hypothetical protein